MSEHFIVVKLGTAQIAPALHNCPNHWTKCNACVTEWIDVTFTKNVLIWDLKEIKLWEKQLIKFVCFLGHNWSWDPFLGKYGPLFYKYYLNYEMNCLLKSSLHVRLSLLLHMRLLKLFVIFQISPLRSDVKLRRKARQAAKNMREIGRQCITAQMEALQRGEKLDNNILSHILQSTSAEDPSITDIEKMIDHFVTFFLAGKQVFSWIIYFCNQTDLRPSNHNKKLWMQSLHLNLD